MGVLSGYQPERVLYYFEQIAGIPHGSGHTQAISDHLVRFANEHGLEVSQDTLGNVVIRKPASAGCEAAPCVILQGHMDMVCEKEADVTLDMEKEGLRLVVQRRRDLTVPIQEEAGIVSDLYDPEDVIVTAEGTTLGGDDGIAVAYMLAILESDRITHPSLECVFTVDEEIGMLGAAGMDMSKLTGKYLLNIDSEDEGHLLAGCAGGCLVTITLPVEKEDYTDGVPVLLTVDGLLGGHSGIEIDKGRANADMLLGRILQDLTLQFSDTDVRLSSLQGGAKDNAIPREAAACLMVKENMIRDIQSFLNEREEVLRGEYGAQDPGIRISIKPEPGQGGRCFTKASEQKVIQMLRCVPNGIQKMSFQTPGLVETSLNLGILKTDDSSVTFSFLVRSNVNSEKWELMKRLRALTEAFGGTIAFAGDYPAWEYRPESHLRDVMCECFLEQYGKQMIVETMHAGVECGLFTDQIEGLDVVSIGPDMKDIHTPKERMDLASVERTWKLILSVLERLGASA